jgi:ribosome-binding protein aMBF1 (putative translation factor)
MSQLVALRMETRRVTLASSEPRVSWPSHLKIAEQQTSPRSRRPVGPRPSLVAAPSSNDYYRLVVVARRSCPSQEPGMTAFAPERLRRTRRAAGMTPEHLAIAIGRSSYSVRDYEVGRITPPTAIVARLATALGCPVASLFAEGPDVHGRDGEHAP